MNTALHTVANVLAVAVVVAALICVARNRLPDWPTVGGLALLEAVLIAITVVDLIQVVNSERNVDMFSLIGYLSAILVLVPASTAWAFVERTRFGSLVIVIACLAVPVMLERTQQIWESGNAW